MKKLMHFVPWLLCAAILLCLAGCTTEPAETTPTTQVSTTAAPTEPSPEMRFQQALDALENAGDISLEIQINREFTLGKEVFSEESMQHLTYQGWGTGTPLVQLDEETFYGSRDAESTPTIYSEVYTGGTVFVTLGDEETISFRGDISQEELEGHYLPAALLSPGLYAAITTEEASDGTTLFFSEPTGAEAWALPEDAQMADASGSAILDASGAITQMTYTISYTYGSAEHTVTYQSQPLTEFTPVTEPEYPAAYRNLEYVDAPYLTMQGAARMAQSETAISSGLESIVTQAGGVVRNQSTSMKLYNRGDAPMASVEYNVYLMDYSANEDHEFKQEEIFRNGSYTIAQDDGDPVPQPELTFQDAQGTCDSILLGNMLFLEFWTDATCTDLGSLYLMEFTLSDDFGDGIQASVCNMFWGDSNFLNSLATDYETKEATCYVSIDKYTHLPTAAGYYMEGAHTIQGQSYMLSAQADQSIEIPALGAYYAITEEMLPEEEPENKPTPLFYHVTGDNGQEMWLFGTIHVGDERTAYLPQEIYDAFAASDALALEIDSKAFDEQSEKDDALQDKISDAYYFSDGTTVESLLEEEAYAEAVRYMKATGNYNMNAPYLKPSIWAQSIDNFYLRQGYTLHGDQGVEERLHKWAADLDKPIREVESTIFQIEMMTGYSQELQLLLLEQSLEGTAPDYWAGVNELFDLWCAGDEQALRDAINEEVDLTQLTEEELAEYEAQKPLEAEYNKAISYDRNEGMLKVAIDYLESGDVVFYAVGLAHLLDGTNGLVDALRAAGYTVELVAYAAP